MTSMKWRDLIVMMVEVIGSVTMFRVGTNGDDVAK